MGKGFFSLGRRGLLQNNPYGIEPGEQLTQTEAHLFLLPQRARETSGETKQQRHSSRK